MGRHPLGGKLPWRVRWVARTMRLPVSCPATSCRPRERAMQHKLISGDNHIDLTYCPADLWSAQAPAKWKQQRAAGRGAQRRAALVRRRQGPRHVERRRPGLPALHQGLVRPYRRDEGGRLRLGQLSRRPAAADHAGAAHRRSRPRRAREGDHLRLPDGQRPDRRRRAPRLGQRPLQRLGGRLRRAAPIPTASFRSPSSPTPTRSRRRPRCGAAPGWG